MNPYARGPCWIALDGKVGEINGRGKRGLMHLPVGGSDGVLKKPGKLREHPGTRSREADLEILRHTTPLMLDDRRGQSEGLLAGKGTKLAQFDIIQKGQAGYMPVRFGQPPQCPLHRADPA